MGQWTTPDANEGVDHDPMSQKSYVWNRNSPLRYQDPSGYDPEFNPFALGDPVFVPNVTASYNAPPEFDLGQYTTLNPQSIANFRLLAFDIDQPEFGAARILSGIHLKFQSLASLRSELGMPEGTGTLARLDVGGKSFYGINAHGQPITLRVNPISRTHAEADVFQQVFNAGVYGGSGDLTVDNKLCGYCGKSGAVKSLARQLGLQAITVNTPTGTITIIP